MVGVVDAALAMVSAAASSSPRSAASLTWSLRNRVSRSGNGKLCEASAAAEARTPVSVLTTVSRELYLFE